MRRAWAELQHGPRQQANSACQRKPTPRPRVHPPAPVPEGRNAPLLVIVVLINGYLRRETVCKILVGVSSVFQTPSLRSASQSMNFPDYNDELAFLTLDHASVSFSNYVLRAPYLRT